jgi:hypothetical protein
MSTNVLDNLSHTVQAHADIIAAGTWQGVPRQRERGVRVAGGVGQRRVQMLQLVKPLSGNLQAQRAHQCAESPVHVVDGIRLDELPGFQDGLNARPRVSRARAKQQFVGRPQRQHVTQGGDRLGPQRRDVRGARFAAGVVDDSGAPGSGLAVVDRQGVPRRLPAAHPAGFPAMPDHVAGRRHRERKTPRKRFGGPLHYAPLQNLMRDSRISVGFGGFPNVFPAPRALFISLLRPCAQVIDCACDTARQHHTQPARSRTGDFPGKSPHHARRHLARIRRSPAANGGGK